MADLAIGNRVAPSAPAKTTSPIPYRSCVTNALSDEFFENRSLRKVRLVLVAPLHDDLAIPSSSRFQELIGNR